MPESEAREVAEVAAVGDNQLFVLILQHPHEKKESLATAVAACGALRRAALVVGLSWPHLSRALGRHADMSRWGVLYLGSVRPAALGSEKEVIALDRGGEPVGDQQSVLHGLEGVVLLDGSWSEVKTLWWRNPWLLKLRRIVLNPRHRSRFGRFRREPRREALSTIEAAGMLLKHLDERGPAIERRLLTTLDQLLNEARSRGEISSGSMQKARSPQLQRH